MTNFELIETLKWQRCKEKHIPYIISVFEQIDAHIWAKDNVPGRHFTYAHAIKHIILAIVESSNNNQGINRLKAHIQGSPLIKKPLIKDHAEIHNLQTYQDAYETVREIYRLPVVLSRQADSQLTIFGFEVRYFHHHGKSSHHSGHAEWTCPTVRIEQTVGNGHLVTIPFSSFSEAELTEYAETRIRQIIGAEIDQSAPSFSDDEAFHGYASDHDIKIDFPKGLVRSHPDDIDKWLPYAISIYRKRMQEIRQNSSENTNLKLKMQQHIDELMVKKTARPKLYLPYEANKNQVKNQRLHVSAMFVYMDPIYPVSCFCAVKAEMPEHTVVESFTGDPPYVQYQIERFIQDCQSEIRTRRALYANQNPLSFTFNPICRIILDSADGYKIGAIVETLRKQCNYDAKSFPDHADDQSIRAFEARIKRKELQLKFALSDNAVWKWDTLFIKTALPLSVIGGLTGAPLSTVLDAGDNHSELGKLIITSAKQTKTGINIEFEPVNTQLQDIYG